MAKKIVLFSDGTGNSSANPHKTNVWRTYKALDTSPEKDPRQVVIYDNGVGTSAFAPKALLGKALGVGLARNVRELYTFLCRTYEEGDEIYAFGFSRGAFTIRVLVALIASQGIIRQKLARDDRDLQRLVKAAYREFRKECFSPSFLSFFLVRVRDALIALGVALRPGLNQYEKVRNIRCTDKDGDPPLISFVGVWDTVDAYGLPIDELTRAWDKVVWPLNAKDRDLSARVGRACQALALDEQRLSFEPMLWNENGSGETRIKQVWFSGMHADVGGGYPDDALSMVPLNWMLDEAESAGLVFIEREREYYREQANALGKMHDSRSGVGSVYRYTPRDVDHLCDEAKPGLAGWLKSILTSAGKCNVVKIDTPKIHKSVFDRIRSCGENYAPINVPEKYAVVDWDGKLLPPEERDTVDGLEKAVDASSRYQKQALVWAGVWQQKVLYYLTLVLLLGFLCLPWLEASAAATIEQHLDTWVGPLIGTVSTLLRDLPGLLGSIPGLGFIGTWAAGYNDYPISFGVGVLGLGLLLLAAKYVNSVMQSDMLYYWRHINEVKYEKSPKPRYVRNGLAKMLSATGFRSHIFKPTNNVLEFVAVAFLLVLLVVVLSRTTYTVVDGFGLICSEDENKAEMYEGTVVFDPKAYCFDTGIKLKKGSEYVAAVRFKDWKDETIRADGKGWIDAPKRMYLLTPLRRHLFANWYQPIARVKRTLFDRFPVASTHPVIVDEQENPNEIHMHFTARRDGRLYLYLNDAVFFTPGIADHLKGVYTNNKGCAEIRIAKIKAVEREEKIDGEESSDQIAGLEKHIDEELLPFTEMLECKA